MTIPLGPVAPSVDFWSASALARIGNSKQFSSENKARRAEEPIVPVRVLKSPAIPPLL